jgi:hypothetical protein
VVAFFNLKREGLAMVHHLIGGSWGSYRACLDLDPSVVQFENLKGSFAFPFLNRAFPYHLGACSNQVHQASYLNPSSLDFQIAIVTLTYLKF